MQITDEMVEKARHVLRQRPNDVRAALEAALGARKPKCDSDLLKHLRVTAELTAQGMKNSKPEDYLEGQAAACIEDLVGALNYMIHTQEAWEEDVSKIIQRPANIFNRAIDTARATLEKWGLK